MSAAPVGAVAAIAAPAMLEPGATLPQAGQAAGASFSQMLLDGINSANQRVGHADAMVRAFALDDSIPLHQVTFALEQARLSVELMMQVRTRLVESYQRVMEMQL